jgi:hypothetical protein
LVRVLELGFLNYFLNILLIFFSKISSPVKLVVAKCWDPNPKGYFTVSKMEPVRPIDPSAWVAHTQAHTQGTGGHYDTVQSNNYRKNGGGNNNFDRLSHSISTLGSNSSLSSSFDDDSTVSTEYYNNYQRNMFNNMNNKKDGIVNINNGSTFMTTATDFTANDQLNLTVDTDLETVVRAMAAPDSGLDVRARNWLKITIPNSFIGSDVVDWLFNHVEGFLDRRDARKYACNMLRYGYIRHAITKLRFSEQCYYVFGDFNESTLNSQMMNLNGGSNNLFTLNEESDGDYSDTMSNMSDVMSEQGNFYAPMRFPAPPLPATTKNGPISLYSTGAIYQKHYQQQQIKMYSNLGGIGGPPPPPSYMSSSSSNSTQSNQSNSTTSQTFASSQAATMSQVTSDDDIGNTMIMSNWDNERSSVVDDSLGKHFDASSIGSLISNSNSTGNYQYNDNRHYQQQQQQQKFNNNNHKLRNNGAIIPDNRSDSCQMYFSSKNMERNNSNSQLTNTNTSTSSSSYYNQKSGPNSSNSLLSDATAQSMYSQYNSQSLSTTSDAHTTLMTNDNHNSLKLKSKTSQKNNISVPTTPIVGEGIYTSNSGWF